MTFYALAVYTYLSVIATKFVNACTGAKDAEILVTVVTTILAMVAHQ